MKTVKDYLDLGLVFVGDDRLLSASNDNDSKEVCMSGLCIAHKRYCDGLRGGNAIFFYASEWAPTSFAWRNNDGVKPEYKGLIDVCFEGGAVSHNESAIDFEWSLDDENYIAKWRPVVLQSYDAHENKDSSFTLPVGIDSPELREALKLFNDYMKTNPKFTIKEEAPSRTMTVNIEGRDYLIPSRTPTVSPKEDKPMKLSREPKVIFSTESTIFGDRLKEVIGGYEASSLDMSAITGKPMKPVYTAEMHAKCEPPPIGSMVLIDEESESGVRYEDHQTIVTDMRGNIPPPLKVMAILTSDVGRRIAVLQNKNNELHCFKLSSVRPIKPIIKTIKVNGADVPAPMSEAPKLGAKFYNPSICYHDYFDAAEWIGDENDILWLSRGLIHSTKAAAIAHAKAMLGIDPNA